MSANDYVRLLTAKPAPEVLVREGLRLLEADFRRLALLALADWEQLGLGSLEGSRNVLADVFGAVASLQRPSWGNWNGLVGTLRKARNQLRQHGSPELRARVDQSARLNAALDQLDESLDPVVARGLQPLAKLARASLSAKAKLGQVLALPITLRNRIAHDAPADPQWWADAAAALRPLLALHARPAPESSEPLPEPWFLVEGDNVWAFNGIDNDGTPLYVNAQGGRHVPERSQAVLLSFQKLLGKTDVQERDFRKLLGSLAPEEIRGVFFGDYLLGRPVGSGGFAMVHVGRHLSTGRKVALKLLNDGLQGEDRVRFQQEAAYLARLDHANVVQVLGHGEETWSVPRQFSLANDEWFAQFKQSAPLKAFIALEWVDGRTLEAVFREGASDGRVDVATLIDWFAQAAEALAEVHKAGLIHRDVKPSNLMATPSGQIKLMDFGIARSQNEARTLETATGHALGTPAYMSPEQVRAVSADAGAGPLSDVYSLCATFYELFTAARVYHHDQVDAATVLTKKLNGEVPEAPRRLRSGLPWEIETLLLGGMQAEPTDRPKSMDALAADLRRLQRNEPIQYRRPPLHRRVQLFYRRRRTLVQMTAVFLLISLVGTGVASYALRAQRTLTASERSEKKRQEGLALAAEKAKEEAEKAKGEAEKAKGEAVKGQTEAEVNKYHEEYLADLRGVRPLWDQGRVGEVRSLLAKHHPSKHPGRAGEAVALEWHYWWGLVEGARWTVKPEGVVSRVAFSPDGKTVAGLTRSGTVKLWNASDGKELPGLVADAWAFAFSPDSRSIATARPGAMRLWDVATRKVVKEFRGNWGLNVRAVAFTPDGSHLVAPQAIMSNGLGYWEAASGKYVRDLIHNQHNNRSMPNIDPRPSYPDGHSDWIVSLSFSRDGKRVASASFDGTVRLWSVPEGKHLRTFSAHGGPVIAVAFSPDGKRIASASAWKEVKVRTEVRREPGDVKVWDPDTGDVQLTLTRSSTELKIAAKTPDGKWVPSGDFRMEFSPDGGRLLGVGDVSVKVWDAVSGKELMDLKGHDGRVLSAAFSPDGRSIVSSGDDGAVKLHSAVSQDGLDVPGIDRAVNGAALDQTGARLAAIVGGRLRLWATADASKPVWDKPWGHPNLSGIPSRLSVTTFSADGRHLVCGQPYGKVLWVRPESGEAVREAPARAIFGALSADGKLFAWGKDDNKVRLTDAEAGKEIAEWEHMKPFQVGEERLPPRVTALAFSPDGKQLASAGKDGVIRIWETATRKLVLAVTEVCRGGIRSMAYHPQGKILATAGEDDTLKLWDAQTGKQVAVLNGHLQPVQMVAFTPDGRRLVTAAGQEKGKTAGEVKVWAWEKNLEVLALKTPPGARCIAVSGDSRHLAVGGGIWDDDGNRTHGFLRFWAGGDGTGKALPSEAPDAQAGVLAVKGHQGAVLSVVFSPDGKTFASGGQDNAVLLRAADGKLLASLEKHTGPVLSLAFSPDGKSLLSGGRDGTVRLWDCERKRLLWTNRPHERDLDVIALAFSPDGKRVAALTKPQTNGPAAVAVFSVAGGKTERELQGAYHSVGFSSDSKSLVACKGETVETLALSGEGPGNSLGASGVKAVYCRAKGAPLGVARWGADLQAWDTDTGLTAFVLIGGADYVNCVGMSEDGRRWAAFHVAMDYRTQSNAGAARVWDVATGKLLLHVGDARSAALDARGARLAWGDSSGVVRVRTVPDKSEIATVDDGAANRWKPSVFNRTYGSSDNAHAIRALTFSADGALLAGMDGTTLKIWDSKTGHEVHVLQRNCRNVRSVAFRPDGKVLVSLGEDCCRWDTSSGRLLGSWKAEKAARSAAFSADGKRLAYVDGPSARLRDLEADKELHQFAPQAGRAVVGVTFAGQRCLACVGGETKAEPVTVRDVVSGATVSNNKGFSASAEQPLRDGGRWLVVTGGYQTRLLDLHQGKPGPVLKTGVGFGGPLAVSRDGRKVVGVMTNGPNPSVALWDVRTGKWASTPHLNRPGQKIQELLFSPDGQRLAIILDPGAATKTSLREGGVKIVALKP